MRTFKISMAAAAAAAIAIPLAAWAYTHGKPGLWEVTSQVAFVNGGPQIPPAQLEVMKQKGIQIPGMGGPVVNQVCVTPEQAAMDTPPPDPQHRCELQNATHDGHAFDADLVCTGEHQMTGHLNVVYDSDEHYTGKMHFVGKGRNGQEMEMNNEVSGVFKSADCGSVKPYIPGSHPGS